jgi:chromosome segregation ATPase
MMKPVDWTQMLTELAAALDQSASELTRHEQALASPLLTSDLSGERHISWQRALERFGERLQDCQNQVAQAERQTEQAEAALVRQEEETRKFHSQLEQIRQQLAKPPAAVVE